MKAFNILMSVLIISCSAGKEDQDVVVVDLQSEYKKSQDITFGLKSTTEERVYFHFEGWHYNYDRETGWRPFDNDLLSKIELKQESNLWLEPKTKLDFKINSQQFLKKFSAIPDSFKVRVVYWYTSDEEKARHVFSRSFVIKG